MTLKQTRPNEQELQIKCPDEAGTKGREDLSEELVNHRRHLIQKG